MAKKLGIIRMSKVLVNSLPMNVMRAMFSHKHSSRLIQKNVPRILNPWITEPYLRKFRIIF